MKQQYKVVERQVLYLADAKQGKWLVKETCKSRKAANELLKRLEEAQA